MDNTKRATPDPIDPILEAKPVNEAQSNDLIQIALQDLYLKMLKQDKLRRVPIMGDCEPPETIPEQRDLVVKKIRAIEAALS